MTKIELLERIQDALQRDEKLDFNMKLDDIEEWDSLAIVSIISLYDGLFKKIITGNDLRECKTVEDVVNLAKEHL
ncbi:MULTISPECIES: acyl carrier protein [Campylobacter]|uniref:acyl carrier protein n=1 Tax=Campylobacter TaxID=194 RepID=UPI000A32DB17|nr:MULTISPECIES: acyl carrier protein [Campylobacter]